MKNNDLGSQTISLSHLSWTVMDGGSALASSITSALPKLWELEPLLEVLQELGVQDLEDLNYIQESDLLHVLKPVEVRKLLSHCKTRSTCFDLYIMQIYCNYIILQG